MRVHTVRGPAGGPTRSIGVRRNHISTRCPQLREVTCGAAVSEQPSIPHELPLFPVQPIGVFLPGMTKTLHLYEPHFISLMDECLASEHRLMATAVLEPYMGDKEGSSASGGTGGEDAGPGAFVGGYNFSLSCGCLVQVLSAKPYTGGYLVRIRGEARLGISGLPQTGPYMRAQVYPLPDQPPAVGRDREAELRAKVEQLREIMRDVQNLASKFRCDETAALQQAMRWLHGAPLTPGIMLPTQMAQATSHPHPHSQASSEAAPSSSAPSAGPASSGQRQQGEGEHLQQQVPSQRSDLGGSGADVGPLASVSEQRAELELASTAAASGGVGAAGTGAAASGADWDEEEQFDPEEAVRWSWAALQWLPHASTEERMYIVRTRLLAMDTRNVGRRLDLALEAMGAARASLAAKCALKGASV